MSEDLMNFDIPINNSSIIKVIGVGGGGSNAVNYMYGLGIKDVSFVVCNTDAQAMENSPVPVKIQLGVTLTEGRGAGNLPQMGEEAARENYEDIKNIDFLYGYFIGISLFRHRQISLSKNLFSIYLYCPVRPVA